MEPESHPEIGRGHRTHSMFWVLIVPAVWFFFLLATSGEFGQRHGDALMWALRAAVAVGFGLLAFVAALFFRRERQWRELARGRALWPSKKRPFLKGFLWTFFLLPILEIAVMFAINPNVSEDLTLFVVGMTMGGFVVNLLLAAVVGGMGKAWHNTRPTGRPKDQIGVGEETHHEMMERQARAYMEERARDRK